jgi:hypothetical protein
LNKLIFEKGIIVMNLIMGWLISNWVLRILSRKHILFFLVFSTKKIKEWYYIIIVYVSTYLQKIKLMQGNIETFNIVLLKLQERLLREYWDKILYIELRRKIGARPLLILRYLELLKHQNRFLLFNCINIWYQIVVMF